MNTEVKHFTGMLPPAQDKCQECAVEHDPTQPHNRQSLYYQMKFYQQYSRWPTWADAMAHCAPEVQEAWRKGLADVGVVVE